MAGPSIRHWLNLVLEALQPWGVSKTDLFDQSLREMAAKVPDLRDRLKRFIDIKLPNPLSRDALVGKHDRPFTALLVGYWHCHLSRDAILIYRLQDRCVQLVMICQHSDIEGKRLVATARKVA